ncbi:Interleukin-1 beta [Sciurus carolinensis]|uniref:Multifunctional fusion protein n=1 Tax=Sciurus carolinensis TaxID=30640 RepID=A0AA41N873_SCICA|nr:Interleukin-1 beta [Sciurus carolinensis]
MKTNGHEIPYTLEVKEEVLGDTNLGVLPSSVQDLVAKEAELDEAIGTRLCRPPGWSVEPILCDPWDDEAFVCDAAVRSLNCRLRDIQQKYLVLSDPCELKALHLNGPNLNQQVVFSMSFVQGAESNNKTPVALGLKGKNLYLSCVKKEDKPTLQLESVDPRHYPKKKMEPRFVFNKIEIKDKVEFESAEFPNWYISTSQAEHMPVFLGNSGGQDIMDFTMEFVSS